jgi:hypothetical protein
LALRTIEKSELPLRRFRRSTAALALVDRIARSSYP